MIATNKQCGCNEHASTREKSAIKGQTTDRDQPTIEVQATDEESAIKAQATAEQSGIKGQMTSKEQTAPKLHSTGSVQPAGRAEPVAPGYALLQDLAHHQPVPADGILTRKLHEADHVKSILFTFAPGQELSEHTATMPAIMYFISGEADVGLGDDTIPARAGTFVHMDAQLRHSIKAKTDVTMLLVLFRAHKARRE